MYLKVPKTVNTLAMLAVIACSTSSGQNTRVDVAKHLRAIPKVCESIEPAATSDSGLTNLDVRGLVGEAVCKGAGDMLGDYTYTVTSSRREQTKNGKTKEESSSYEVFFPTLKSGMRTRGVLVVTSRNGVAVPQEELEKERMKAAERIEKEEEKIAQSKAIESGPPDSVKGMLPLGMYAHTTISRSAFGRKTGGATLAVHDFLRTCDLTPARRERVAGRDTIIFNFVPRPDAQLADNQKYIARLTGELWIDAQDHIVTRLVGWPSPATSRKPGETQVIPTSGARPPAVYVEMMRVREGFWLPRTIRINGADYPTLFDGVTTDHFSNYSNYIRFTTEVKDVDVTAPMHP
ncbi:MAG: hypothetical protein ABI967_13490 [bacterium]